MKCDKTRVTIIESNSGVVINLNKFLKLKNMCQVIMYIASANLWQTFLLDMHWFQI